MLRGDGQIKKINCRIRGRTKVARGIIEMEVKEYGQIVLSPLDRKPGYYCTNISA